MKRLVQVCKWMKFRANEQFFLSFSFFVLINREEFFLKDEGTF